MHRYFLFILVLISIGAGSLNAIEGNDNSFAKKALRNVCPSINETIVTKVGCSYVELSKTLTQAHKFWVWMAAVMDVAIKNTNSALQDMHDALMLEGYAGKSNDLISKTGFTWGKQAMNPTEQAIVRARFLMEDKTKKSVRFAPDNVWNAWRNSSETQVKFEAYIDAVLNKPSVVVPEAKRAAPIVALQANEDNCIDPMPEVSEAAAKAAAKLVAQKLEEEAQWLENQGIARKAFSESEEAARKVIIKDEASEARILQKGFTTGEAAAKQAEQARVEAEKIAAEKAEQERLAAAKAKNEEAARVAALEKQEQAERTALETVEGEKAQQIIQDLLLQATLAARQFLNFEGDHHGPATLVMTTPEMLASGQAGISTPQGSSPALVKEAAVGSDDDTSTSSSSETGTSSANLSPVDYASPPRNVYGGDFTSPDHSANRKSTSHHRRSSSVALNGSLVAVLSPLNGVGDRTPDRPTTPGEGPSAITTSSVAAVSQPFTGDNERTPDRPTVSSGQEVESGKTPNRTILTTMLGRAALSPGKKGIFQEVDSVRIEVLRLESVEPINRDDAWTLDFNKCISNLIALMNINRNSLPQNKREELNGLFSKMIVLGGKSKSTQGEVSSVPDVGSSTAVGLPASRNMRPTAQTAPRAPHTGTISFTPLTPAPAGASLPPKVSAKRPCTKCIVS